MSELSVLLDKCVKLISKADTLIITAGAGMGCDSGLPDFRGKDGLWAAYPALGKAKFKFQDIANPNAFHSHTRLAWGFYGHRLNLYRNIVPHEGFNILLKLAKSKHDYAVITSNVDGAFQKAGFEPNRLVELHGSIHRLQCIKPCSQDLWSADKLNLVIDEEKCSLTSDIPLCPNCGALARPNILMFDDGEWIERETCSYLRAGDLIRSLKNPVILEFGAGTSLPAIRYFGDNTLNPLIRVNPQESAVNRRDHVGVPMTALEFCKYLEVRV